MKVQFTENGSRDANQSLIATRMPLSEFKPILGKLDEAGYYSLECWGGATFDSCLRYLGEDPWTGCAPSVKPAQTPSCKCFSGARTCWAISIIRMTSCVNSCARVWKTALTSSASSMRSTILRNIEVAVDETLRAGAHASGTICFTISPIHTLDAYVKMAREMEKMGVQSICIKDMAGIMGRRRAMTS